MTLSLRPFTAMKRSSRLALVAAALSFTLATTAWAQTSPVGFWRTIDDETGQPKSVVQIYEEDGSLYGDVVEILDAGEDAPRNEAGEIICEVCDGARKDQPVEGMNILWDLEQDGDEWNGGRILDPENGKTYKVKMWLEEGGLMVRGYIGFSLLGRSQQWEWIGATL